MLFTLSANGSSSGAGCSGWVIRVRSGRAGAPSSGPFVVGIALSGFPWRHVNGGLSCIRNARIAAGPQVLLNGRLLGVGSQDVVIGAGTRVLQAGQDRFAERLGVAHRDETPQ